MNQALSTRSPWISLVILLGLMFILSFVIQFASALFFQAITGSNVEMLDSNALKEQPGLLYLLLAGGTLGAFLLPAFFLRCWESDPTYLPGRRTSFSVFLLACVLLAVLSPAMQLLGEWNANMRLPSGMRAIEVWMRAQEDSSARLTGSIVMTDRLDLLLCNIIVMAVLPAVGEEFFFRGSLQHIVERLVGNQHMSVWLVAIIFSAIHVQFYGFFPRMALGILFGYMVIWTQNIWVPILGHFLNNAAVAVIAYNYAREGKTYEDLQTYEKYPIFVYIGSILIAILVAIWFYKKAKKTGIDGARLGKD